ncbi:FAD-binding oxidoreductase [Streptomyces sp. T028]|uniref:FAD-binding oxidoreductase n=1 Tax=Streptomyces sp. T028 TaxID=3394379 RepID=UPI003A893485
MSEADFKNFPTDFKGEVFRPRDSGYAAARKLFYTHTDHATPALIARAADAQDVLAVARFAGETGTPLAVRAGGHSVDGSGMPDGALVADVSALKAVDLDRDTGIVRLGSGVLLGEMDTFLEKHDLVVPAGTVSNTGVAGLTLGGGVGYNMRRYGATVDNLLSMEVATVDGRLVTASATENPDLFWALRGGGGNFGVVTSFEFQARPLGPQVAAGFIPFPAASAPDVLAAWREHMADVPRELSVIAAMTQCPPMPFVPEHYHNADVVLLLVVHTGAPEKLEGLVDGLAALGPAIVKAVQPVPWSVANSMLDAIAPPDHRSYTKGAYLSELTDDVIDIVTRHAAAHLPSPGPVASTVQNLWSMGGAITEDFDEDSAAFSREGANWFWETVTLWDTPDQDAGFHAWVDGVHAELKPHVRDNCYVNLSTDNGPEWRRGVWGSAGKYARLERAKADWDPYNLLRFNKNIEPTKAD